jgi:RNA polymerase sigma factor (TIGR02999 family)
MKTNDPERIRELLVQAREGNEEALADLFPLLYDSLRQLSHRELRRRGPDQTLSTTALIHEAYLKLAPGTGVEWADRQHFLRVAARAMRQVLVDRARRRASARRRENRLGHSVTGGVRRFQVGWEELLDLDQAMDRLESLDERLHTVVELRFFGGLTEREVAGALGVSPRTVRRDWTKARLFLHREMYPERSVG